jgi:hypothetical protein
MFNISFLFPFAFPFFFTHTHTQIVALKSVHFFFSGEGKKNAFYCQSYDIRFDIILWKREKGKKEREEIIIKRAFQSINELMHINGTLK